MRESGSKSHGSDLFDHRRGDGKVGIGEANRLLGWTASAGLISIVAYCLQFTLVQGLSVFGVTIAVAGAALLVGSLAGFLFGIPRVQSGEPQTPAVAGPQPPSGVTSLPNTNLVQISDWLTKVLVGVGLTQIGNLGSAAAALGRVLRPALGDTPSSSSFGVAVALYFLVLGFLVGYIETRTVLSAAFHEADVQQLTAVITTRITKKLEGIQEKDAAALGLVQQQLDLAPDEAPGPEDLTTALREASAPVKIQTFMRARDARRRLQESDPSRLGQVAPVFRALIDIDDQQRYHRNHGQLAYILKDRQPSPDYAEAIEELTKAIALRDREGETNTYPLYEFNRAECRIMLAPTDAKSREAILADLRVAAKSLWLRNEIRDSPKIASWMTENNITLDSLT